MATNDSGTSGAPESSRNAKRFPTTSTAASPIQSSTSEENLPRPKPSMVKRVERSFPPFDSASVAAIEAQPPPPPSSLDSAERPKPMRKHQPVTKPLPPVPNSQLPPPASQPNADRSSASFLPPGTPPKAVSFLTGSGGAPRTKKPSGLDSKASSDSHLNERTATKPTEQPPNSTPRRASEASESNNGLPTVSDPRAVRHVAGVTEVGSDDAIDEIILAAGLEDPEAGIVIPPNAGAELRRKLEMKRQKRLEGRKSVVVNKSPVAKTGYLLKEGGGRFTRFQKRWFVQKGHYLYYYKKQGDVYPCGAIHLLSCAVRPVGGSTGSVCLSSSGGGSNASIGPSPLSTSSSGLFRFNLITPSKTYLLQAESERDMHEWIDCLSQATLTMLEAQLGVSLNQQTTSLGSSLKTAASVAGAGTAAAAVGPAGAPGIAAGAAATSATGGAVSPGGTGVVKAVTAATLLREINALDQARERIGALISNGPAVCAECGSTEVTWAHVSMATLVCTACSQVLRKLVGEEWLIPRQLNDPLSWQPEHISIFETTGGPNRRNTAVWERRLVHKDARFSMNKPGPADSEPHREQFLSAKYLQRRFGVYPLQSHLWAKRGRNDPPKRYWFVLSDVSAGDKTLAMFPGVSTGNPSELVDAFDLATVGIIFPESLAEVSADMLSAANLKPPSTSTNPGKDDEKEPPARLFENTATALSLIKPTGNLVLYFTSPVEQLEWLLAIKAAVAGEGGAAGPATAALAAAMTPSTPATSAEDEKKRIEMEEKKKVLVEKRDAFQSVLNEISAEEADLKRRLEELAQKKQDITRMRERVEGQLAELEALEKGVILNEKGLVKSGTVDKLVEMLSHEEYMDPKYLLAFLLTYRSFTTGPELLAKLFARYHVPPPSAPNNADGSRPTPEQIEQHIEQFKRTVQLPIQLRICNVLKHWVSKHFYDFEGDNNLLYLLVAFVQQELRKHQPQFADTILKLVRRRLTGLADDDTPGGARPVPDPSKIPTPIFPRNMAEIDFMEVDPLEMARQVALLEQQLFLAIRPKECLNQSWNKKDKATRAPNITALIERFNSMSRWVTTCCVKPEKIADRRLVISRFLQLCKRCRELNNFNGVFEVWAGLNNTAVHRMKKTWEGLPSREKAIFEEFKALLTSRNNVTYRESLAKADPPCIPYLGVYLTDLTFIEDGNPDYVHGLVNFEKRRKISVVIREIQQFQQTTYPFIPVPPILNFLAGVDGLSPEEAFNLSIANEPKEGTAPNTSPRESGSSESVSSDESPASPADKPSDGGGAKGAAKPKPLPPVRIVRSMSATVNRFVGGTINKKTDTQRENCIDADQGAEQ